MFDLTDEQLANDRDYREFCSRILRELRAIADRHGLIVSGDDERRGLSMYVRIFTRDEDGCTGERVAEARISDHRQARGGPDWSFEISDDEASIARGLAEIERLCREW